MNMSTIKTIPGVPSVRLAFAYTGHPWGVARLELAKQA